MKKNFDKFYIIGQGGYGKQLSHMLKTSGIIKLPIFVDDKLKLNKIAVTTPRTFITFSCNMISNCSCTRIELVETLRKGAR